MAKYITINSVTVQIAPDTCIFHQDGHICIGKFIDPIQANIVVRKQVPDIRMSEIALEKCQSRFISDNNHISIDETIDLVMRDVNTMKEISHEFYVYANLVINQDAINPSWKTDAYLEIAKTLDVSYLKSSHSWNRWQYLARIWKILNAD